MKNTYLKAITALLGSFLFTLPTLSTFAEDQAIEEVVVTGSRIVRSGENAPTPITVVTTEEFQNSGQISLGDYLNDLPSLRSTFSLSNSNRFIGTVGLNLLDLRGLGTDRTLVLVDGKRHIGANNGTTSVDINTIPQALLERVEIITGGASAIYGADAVTGVVNFVMKDDFEGWSAEIYGAQPSDDGGESQRAALTWGTNFADGRGNIAISYEYTNFEEVKSIDREWTNSDWAAIPNIKDTGPNDGIADDLFARNLNDNRLNENGYIWGDAPLDFFGIPAGLGTFFGGVSTAASPTGFTFTDGGALRAFDVGQRFYDRFGDPDNNSRNCPDCLDLNNSEQLFPEVEKNVLFTKGHFDFNDHFRLFGEAKYVNSKALSFGQPAFDFFNFDMFITRDNAFVSPELAAVMDADGLGGVVLERFHTDLGLRGDDIERETWRYVLGASGDIAGSWSYEVSGVLGHYEGDTKFLNNRIEDKFFNAIDAVVDPGTGNIVCRDPAAQADGCVPLNVMGFGVFDPAAKAYAYTSSAGAKEEMDQTVFNVSATGNLINLPAGPLQAAFGAEYRKEESKVDYAQIIKDGLTFMNALAASSGDYDVKEIFGEVSVPLLTGLFAAENLSVDGAVRFSDYDTIGTTTTWKLGLDWQPFSDLRFRATRGEAVRAPNISELFDPQGQNFFAVDDPCNADEIIVAPDPALRQANCDALGAPAGYQSVTDSATLPGVSGGNPNLTEETANTITWGVVLTPRTIPNLTVSIDFWDIDIEDSISSVAAQTILDKCVDGPNINNAFCGNISRDASTFEITNIIQSALNIASLESQGVDYEVLYDWDMGETFGGNWGSLSFHLIGTHMRKRNDFPFQNEPDTKDEVLSELGDPENRYQLNTTYRRGPLSINWRYDWIDSMLLVETDDNKDLQAPLTTGSIHTNDIQFTYSFNDMLDGDLQLFGGVNNVEDQGPAKYLTGNGGGSGMYDTMGRTFYLGVRFNRLPGGQ